MNRLNYFNSFRSLDQNHEDHLTRGFMVLLRNSPLLVAHFYDMCRDLYWRDSVSSGKKEPIPPSLCGLSGQKWSFETQATNPPIETRYLLSVLLVDDGLGRLVDVTRVDRNAVYDGLISAGDEITIVLENKPRSSNVWDAQLSPTIKNLSEDTYLFPRPCIICWSEVISLVNNLINSSDITQQEKMLFEDFVNYLDVNYSFLNPFNTFALCKNDDGLLQRRIKTLLESIVTDPSVVQYHRGWGYYIATPFSYLRQIGLIHQRKEDGDWSLELSFYAGDTQTQAIALYQRDIEDDPGALGDGWVVKPNFHFAFRSQNLVWYQSRDVYQFVNFWKDELSKIHQYEREDVEELLKELEQKNIITITKFEHDLLDQKFYKTRMSRLNCCPGLGLIYTLSSKDAISLDNSGDLEAHLAKKLKEGVDYFRDHLPFIRKFDTSKKTNLYQ
jgi:hypothetical protein